MATSISVRWLLVVFLVGLADADPLTAVGAPSSLPAKAAATELQMGLTSTLLEQEATGTAASEGATSDEAASGIEVNENQPAFADHFTSRLSTSETVSLKALQLAKEQSVKGLVDGGIVLICFGTFLMYRKPETTQVSLSKAGSLLGHLFGGEQQSQEVQEAHLEDCDTIPSCLFNLLRSLLGFLLPPAHAVLNFVTSMGVGALLFFAGVTLLLNGARMGWLNIHVPHVVSTDAHLASLVTAEWVLMDQTMILDAAFCASLNRTHGLVELRTGTSNHPTTCGFCLEGYVSSDGVHGPHATDLCTQASTGASEHCKVLHRAALGSDESSLCGACLSGYTGAPAPSVAACRPLAVCPSGFARLSTDEYVTGQCVDNCPAGTAVATDGTGSVCQACGVESYTDVVDSSSCKACSLYSCTASTAVSARCMKSANYAGAETCRPTPTYFFSSTATVGLKLGLRSVRDLHADPNFAGGASGSPVTHYADRFTIRSAAGPRHGPFAEQTFAYEWHVESDVNPDAFRTLSIPFGLETPVQIRGVLRTPPGYQRPSKASVLVELPYGNEIRYRPSNRYLITSQNVFNQDMGHLYTSADLTLPVADAAAWSTAEWKATSDSAGSASTLLDEGLMAPINGGSGNWSITVPLTLPQDPATVNCPPLPVRITVTAADGVSRRQYKIYTVGSDRTSCYNSDAQAGLNVLRALNAPIVAAVDGIMDA